MGFAVRKLGGKATEMMKHDGAEQPPGKFGIDDCLGGVMRKLVSVCSIVFGALIAFPGCGSDAGDRLVLSFDRFTNAGLEQADGVFDTHAEVDICGFLCFQEEEVTTEPFTQTTAGAVFTNRGKANIVLDSYTLLVPGSGIEEMTRPITAMIPGGRCSNDPSQACAVDDECIGGACVHTSTTVTFLLYDFDFKDRVLLGTCPSLAIDETGALIVENADSVIHQELTAILTFSGVDDRNERYTVTASYPSSFDNFDACEEE